MYIIYTHIIYNIYLILYTIYTILYTIYITKRTLRLVIVSKIMYTIIIMYIGIY